MSRKMLMDAAHPEEIRVVICNNNTVEEFEYQTQSRKSIKGYIYLAKVTRVEPSLQAAFVDFGANKHGFLPFSEIHPDYYQIPVSDRQKLLEELKGSQRSESTKEKSRAKAQSESIDSASEVDDANIEPGISEEGEPEVDAVFSNHHEVDDDEPRERPQFYKRYRIQEVIKKDQVILVQIEKEERGNKGASLTTYMSLAGRYCVLMPNSTKGGGVSRKIADDQDRHRLKKIAIEFTQELDGQGAVIIRTAGAYKTKTEIKRDLQYLQKLWDNIRENTVKSTAPTFIHEEGDVIKKALRDLYDSDIDEILIDGEKAYEAASEFMKLILPRHVNKVKLYKGTVPLFAKTGVDKQIAELYSNKVSLRSGGYLVINHTEALVAVDVNSGRATSERNIEDTALKTNLEAAYEIARQMRLRDLSGLIVVDFIDMDELRNKKAVERALRDVLTQDKAKVQVGRISSFGLLEMSRQRLRQTLMESNTEICPHCNGRGRVRFVDATATVVLRAIESEMAQSNADEIYVSGSAPLMFYLSNNKRTELLKLEKALGGKISLYEDESAGGDGFFIESKKANKKKVEEKALSGIDRGLTAEEAPLEAEEDVNQPHHKIRFKKKSAPSKVEAQSEEISIEPIDEITDEEEQPKIRFERHKPQNQGSRHNKNFKHPRGDNRSKNYRKDSQNEPKSEPTHEIHHEPRAETRNKPMRNDFRKDPRNEGRADTRKEYRNEPRIEAHNEPYDDKYDEEMAMRRKQNQSLLKEIWKKIVD
jgi:ribonuclease E